MLTTILKSCILRLLLLYTKGQVIDNCRMCKREVESKIKRCPYCGTFNPTLKVKEIWIGIAFVLATMAVYMYFFPQS